MARYKPIDLQPKLIPVDLAAQLLPGTFEHALHHLLEHAIDLPPFDARYRHDTTGAPAYPPAMLLRIVRFAYARGIVSSRAIARACEEHITFIALSGDSRPHFTTIAHFVSTLGDQIAPIFAAVLAVCDRQGLIGREMFAIDGVKLPGNASKHRSGTRADFERQAEKMERAAEAMLARHRAEDAREVEPTLTAKDTARRERLVRDATDLRTWLARNPDDRRGANGAVRKRNRTDNERAKMATSKGVIQGCTGGATVDAAHQIIVDAQAHGVGAEQELLLPVVEATAALRTEATVLTADAGYHSEANLRALAEALVPALIADKDMRRRDPRFATQERYTTRPDPLHDKSKPARKPLEVFGPEDFQYDPVARTCVCPAGKSLYRRGAAPRCAGASTAQRAAHNTHSASPRWSPSLGTCARTSDSIASRCAAAPRSIRSGSCTASCTTSRSWPTQDTRRRRRTRCHVDSPLDRHAFSVDQQNIAAAIVTASR